jgi:hypothetical protein
MGTVLPFTVMTLRCYPSRDLGGLGEEDHDIDAASPVERELIGISREVS